MMQMVPGTNFPTWKFKNKGGAKALRILEVRLQADREDREEQKNRNAGVVLRGDGIGYTDQRLGQLRHAKSRFALDRQAYRAWLDLRASQPATPARAPMSLRAYAVEAAADAFGAPYLWYSLPCELAASIAVLMPAVHRRVAAVAAEGARAHVPFEFWANTAASLGGAVPGRYRTYRGLVLSDLEEFKALGAFNGNAAEDWAAEAAEEARREWHEGPGFRPRALEMPTFFLTILDLSGDKTFTNDDIHKIKVVAQTLAVLQLDGTLLTDEGLRWITSALGDEDAYVRLEVLTLAGTQVTNAAVVKLGRLSSLRMLDLRGTKCDPKITPLLYRTATQSLPGQSIRSFRPARARTELDERSTTTQTGHRVSSTTELELFGASYSPARRLGLLRLLASLEGDTPHPPAQWTKPICVHVDGVVRAAPEYVSSADNLYYQLGALSGPARALHRSGFGVVTSTSGLNRETFHNDEYDPGRRRTAFDARNDAVAGGVYEGQGKTGGRVTRFEGAFRRSRVAGAAAELEPLSDSEAEEERVFQARVDEREDLMLQASDDRRNGRFYGAPRPVRRAERRIVATEESRLMLLRHLACPDPFCPAPIGGLVADAAAGSAQASSSGGKRIVEGDILTKKKPRTSLNALLDFMPRPSPTLARHSPGSQSAAPLPLSSFRSSSAAPSSFAPATPPSSYLGRNVLVSASPRPGRLANRFALQEQDGAKAKQAATLKPSAVAGRKPLPVSVPTKPARPLFQQAHH